MGVRSAYSANPDIELRSRARHAPLTPVAASRRSRGFVIEGGG